MTDLSTILGQLTPEQRDLFLSRLSERSAAAPVSRVVPRRGRRSGVEPLSFAQERLWFLEQLEPGNAAYVLTSATRLSGKVEISALMAAAAGMARRHEALRTTFGIEGGRPCQVVAPEGALPLAVVDLNGMAPGRREEEARRLVAQESVRPFSLGGGPLARMILVHFEATEHWLLLSMHHIISDGWSGGIFLRELAALYGGLLRGEPAPLPDPELQYADYAVWQREWLTSEALESQIAYWRERLAGAPLLDLPLDRPRPRLRSPRGRRLLERLPPELSAALAGWSPRQGATLFMTLAAAFATLLNRHSGQDDVVVGSPIANRNRRETEGVVGFFVNLVVLRLDLGGNPRFQALVSRARETLAGAYAHQDLPFEKLVEALEPVRDPMYTPLFQTLLTLQNAPLRFDLAGLELSRIEIEGAAAKYDFSLELLESEEGIGCYWWYSTEVLDPTTVARLARHFAALLAAVVENPERRLAELPLLTPAERHALLAEWNDEPQVYPEGELLHAVFEGWAAHTPEAVALVHERDRLTYGELNARANRLARRLIGWGVRPEARVAIGAERRFEMVVGLLAILKAGGAYVPLDPSYPHERLAAMAAMAAGSGAAILLVDRRHVATLGKLAAWERVVDLDDVAGSSAEKSGDPAPRGLADHPAYVLFTSGSTGLPKGVVVPHRAIGNRLRSHAAADLDPGSRVLQKTTISFDVSLIEIFGPLYAGGASVLARAGGQQDAGYLAQLIVEEGITHLNGPPSLLTALLEQAALCRAGSLRSVVTGSEAVTTELPHRVHAVLAAKLYNRYGPTEATIAVTSWLCERGVAERVLPIGRPIARAEIYLVGRDRRLLPLGATGEVMIGGACLARGYLDRPDLTAESFLPHPFSAEPGARLYRTGDLARRRADGALEFVGRRDGQVKIRGSRVELADVEAALLRHPGVQAAVVVANADGASSQLAAYVVPKNGSTLAPQELRVSLVARLPEYMVPSGFAVLGALPLTPSGKVDRHRLPAVLWQAQAAYVPPQTPAEELMAGIWSRVLRRERVGIEDNFFELGGHSLLATRVISQVREIFGAEVPLRAIFESPTVAGLAAKVELAGNGWRVPTIRPMARPALLPLSFAQERLWFLDQLEPDSARYLIGSVVRLEGDLDRRALGHGLGEIVRRHESLRTVFAVADGQPIQVIQPAAPAALPVVDLASLDADRREREVRRLSAAEAARPFDLARGPLLRMTLVALRSAPEPEHVALLTLHHIVADGWSMGVLVRELGALYAAAARGTRSALPELPIQYADFALWQRQVLAGDALREELAYWRQALAGLAPLALPTDRPRPPALTSRGGVCRRLLAPELCRGLAAAGRQRDATLFMTLLSTFAVLLHRYAGQDDIAVGSAIANRGRAELEGLIGFFVNTLVLRADCGEDPDYAELVARVRRMALGAFAHQDLPFEKLVEVLQTQRDAGRTPLFQVLLALENTGVERLALPGLTLTMGEPEASPAKFELTLIFKETEQGLAGLWSFPLDLFDAVTVERMAGHYETLLSQVSESGPRPVHLSELSLLGAAERWQLVQEWSERAEDVPRGMTVDRLFAEQAARAPQAVALVSADGEITYGELARRAGRLAARLRGVGVGPEVAVGLCLPRSAAMVVATLAVLQAGGVYVPLDPSYPNGRLAFLLHDARVAVLVTEEPLLAVFGKDGQPARLAVVCLDRLGAEADPPANVAAAVSPDHLAYVMYTSGSTGMPKGVAVPHRAIVRLVRGGFAELGPAEVLLQLAPTSFDAATFEIWGALCTGGRLVIAPPGLLSPDEIGDLLARHGVTTLWLTAGLFHQLVEPGPERLGPVRQLLAGGDVLSVAHVQRALPAGLGRRLINGYGPTENTTFTCCESMLDGGDLAGSVPLGRPIAGTRVYLLDVDGGLAPIGVPGELCAGGAGLARGYVGRPERTAERFVPASGACAEAPGARLYRTGDLARYLPDGRIEFLGRIDQQVKIRGF
ncbi:MAG TPA: amino acid adenylation domain-containing protein, partial [Thermoanaerobaculia bacterium]|nr:amino acid adenylation domain-containing protein [Thermoanaerobaculia bacterium]